MIRVLLVCVVSLLTSPALAQEEAPLGGSAWFGLEPYAAAQSPWIYELALDPATWVGTQIVADHRLLWLEVRAPGSRRRAVVCRHPDAPNRTDDSRVRTLVPDGSNPRIREWVDLRMYCFGRALDSLVNGAEITPHYGFRTRGRNRWVARPNEPGEPGVHEIDGEPFTLTMPESTPTEPGPVSIALRRSDVRSEGQLSFQVTVRAGDDQTHRVYLRDDLFRFDVQGPLGRVECALPRQVIVPIVDFYKTLSRRRTARAVIEATRACPEHTFELPGVYDVTPLVDLVYDGARYEIEAETGTFAGPSTPIRIRAGNGRYFERLPETHPIHARIDQGARR